MVNALMQICAKVGMQATPEGYEPNGDVVAEARGDALQTGSTISLVNDPFAAAKEADVLYTDVWASMGQEAEQMMRQRIFVNYQINKELMQTARPDAIVMHCLPAHRGEEITD